MIRTKMKTLNETHMGNCPICDNYALLDKGFGKIFLCEKCYYENGNQYNIWSDLE